MKEEVFGLPLEELLLLSCSLLTEQIVFRIFRVG